MIIVVCFKNGIEVTRVKYDNYDFPGSESEFFDFVESNWRRNGFVTYRLAV